MTLSQLRAFTAAAARRERHQEVSDATATRMAMGADMTTWNQYLNSRD